MRPDAEGKTYPERAFTIEPARVAAFRGVVGERAAEGVPPTFVAAADRGDPHDPMPAGVDPRPRGDRVPDDRDRPRRRGWRAGVQRALDDGRARVSGRGRR